QASRAASDRRDVPARRRRRPRGDPRCGTRTSRRTVPPRYRFGTSAIDAAGATELKERSEQTMLVRTLSCVIAMLAISAGIAAAAPRDTNGLLTFGRFNPSLGDTQVYVVNPDGSHGQLVQGPTDTGEHPRWFSDGSHIATCCDLPGGGSRIINPDDGTYRD